MRNRSLCSPAVKDGDSPALPLPDRPSIAVLPFANMSSDPEQDYFADGIVEDILTALSRESWLFVIARNSSFAYKGRAVDVKQIGRELGVRYVVEGSVRKAGNRVRVTAQLIEAETGSHVWAERYERDLERHLRAAGRDHAKGRCRHRPQLRALEIRRSQAKPTENLHAYDFFLRALPEIHEQSEDSVKRAEAHLRKAIELDAGYPEALGMLADIIATRTVNGWHENIMRGLEESLQMSRRALDAGPENSTCLACAASTYVIIGRRFEEGLDLAERALRLHPNSVFVRIRAGVAYVNCGESEKALEQFETALADEPPGSQGSHLYRHVRRAFLCPPLRGLHRLGTAGNERGGRLQHRPPACGGGARTRRADRRGQSGDRGGAEAPAEFLARPFAASSFRHPWMYDLYLDGLRKAGLPEQ